MTPENLRSQKIQELQTRLDNNQAAIDEEFALEQEEADNIASDLPKVERLKLKTFGNSNLAFQAEYLNAEFPDYIHAVRDGELFRKKKNGEFWNPVDPSGLQQYNPFAVGAKNALVEAGSDLTDIAGDVGSGVLSGAATAGGALLGGLPGAIAGGASSGAGLEALRQAIGVKLGVNPEVDGGGVALAGAFGGAAPGLLGVGKAPMQGLSKQVSKALGERTLSENAKSGLLGMGYKNSSKAVAYLTGASEKAVTQYRLNPTLINNMTDADYTTLVADTISSTTKALTKARAKLGSAIRAEGVGLAIPTKNLKSFVTKAFTEAKNPPKSGVVTPAQKEHLAGIKSLYKHLFTGDVPSKRKFSATGKEINQKVKTISKLDNPLDFEELLKLKQDLKESMVFMKSTFNTNKNAASEKVSDFAGGLYSELNKAIDDVLPNNAGKRDSYRKLIEVIDGVDDKLGDPAKFNRFLGGLDNASKKFAKNQVEQLDALVGSDLMSKSNTLEAFNAFNNPTLAPISSQGSTSTTRTLNALGFAPGSGATRQLLASAFSSPAFYRKSLPFVDKTAKALAPTLGVLSNANTSGATQSIYNLLK